MLNMDASRHTIGRRRCEAWFAGLVREMDGEAMDLLFDLLDQWAKGEAKMKLDLRAIVAEAAKKTLADARWLHQHLEKF